MEPTQLQLVLNVVTITGVTSLAAYCYLLKKENRKLATQKEASKAEVAQAIGTAPVAKPVNAAELDIRTLASARRTRWVKGLSSSIS